MATTLTLEALRHVTDASQVDAEQLHELFVDIFFNQDAPDVDIPDNYANDSDDDENALGDDDDRLTNDLIPPTRGEDDDDSDDGSIADSEYERELERRDQEAFGGSLEVNSDFLGWISHDAVFGGDQTAKQPNAAQTAMLRQLDEELGAKTSVSMTLPDRMPSADLSDIDSVQQGQWILHQLCQPGYLLHKTSICHEWGHRRVKAAAEIDAAIRFMVGGREEPAHIAIYKKDCFPVLIAILLEDATTASVAWSVESGRHEPPRLDRGNDGTMVLLAPPLIDIQGNWNVQAPLIPSFARLLWQISEFREKYHTNVRARDQVTAVLGQDIPQLRNVFETPFELFAWRQYAAWYKNFTTMTPDEAKESWQMSHSASLDCVWRGELRALKDFATIPAHDGSSRTLSKTAAPEEWAQNFIRPGAEPATNPRDLVSRCARAVTEQLGLLPTFRIQVYQAYASTGHAVYTPNKVTGKSTERRVPIRSLLHDSPGAILELLTAQSNGNGSLSLTVPRDSLLQAMPLDAWMNSSIGIAASDAVRDEWKRLLQTVADNATKRVMQVVESQLKSALRQAAEQLVITKAVSNLANLCAFGPYEPVELRLSDPPVNALWEARWESVEAVPCRPRGVSQRHAICGAYRDGMTTCFTIVDTNGVPRISINWIDAVDSTDAGMIAKKAQEQRLLVALNSYGVAAIGVAVNGASANRVFGSIQRFLTESVSKLSVCPTVVWQTCEIVNVVARSEFAKAEYPSSTLTQRLAAAVAQTLQDPLLCIARTFDRNRSALELPIGAEAARRADLNTNHLYQWLRYEVGLWITACGIDINAVIARSSPETVLQFVAGLDVNTARRLVQTVERTYGGMIKSRKELAAVLENPSVIRNALASLRIPASTEVLDATLIPPELYGSAARLAVDVAAHMPRPSFPASVAINQLGCCDVNAVARAAQGVVAPGIFDPIASQVDTPDFLEWFGGFPELIPARFPHLTRLLATELMSQGRSTMRRTFRKVTRERFFEVATGISYIGDSAANGRDFGFSTVVKGQVVSGTIERIAVPKSGDADKCSIVVKLAFGVRGVIGLRDIGNPLVHDEVRRYAELAIAQPDTKHPMLLKSLENGQMVSGVVIAPSYENCELRLEWSDPRPTDTMSMVDATGSRNGSNMSSRSSMTGTINTIQLVKIGAVTALLFTRHPKYRDWDSERTAAEMASMNLGEYIVRRATAGGRYYIIAVKVSPEIRNGKAVGVFNVRCHEQRDSNGKLVNTVSNLGRRDVLYDSVEHVVTALIRNSVVRLVEELRFHEKFRTNPSVAGQHFGEELQLPSAEKRVVYALVEHAMLERGTFYAIVYQSREVALQYRPIVITEDGFSIKTRSKGVVTFESIDRMIAGFKSDFMVRRN